jgi:hypothetical protein
MDAQHAQDEQQSGAEQGRAENYAHGQREHPRENNVSHRVALNA